MFVFSPSTCKYIYIYIWLWSDRANHCTTAPPSIVMIIDATIPISVSVSGQKLCLHVVARTQENSTNTTSGKYAVATFSLHLGGNAEDVTEEYQKCKGVCSLLAPAVGLVQ